MGERHERLFLLAIQKLFFRRPRIAAALTRAAGSPSQLFEGERSQLRPYFGRHEDLWRDFLRFDAWGEMESSLARIESMGGRLIAMGDPAYPRLLRNIYDAPPVLTVLGDRPEALELPAVAIVGSRKASRPGRETARRVAEGIAAEGLAVISGMAYGIDAAAHMGAIEGGGLTVAVMGCGPEITYPAAHAELARSIKGCGLIISEFPVGEEPYRSNFPQRNRIISGMALAAIIVEAEERSGSLITARFALEQNREVMAVPGGAGTALARGTNRLIRDGAMLVEGADEIIEALQPLVSTMGFPKRAGHLKNYVDKDTQIFRALRIRRTRGFDELVRMTGLSVNDLSVELVRMKLQGIVEELPGRRWRIRTNDA